MKNSKNNDVSEKYGDIINHTYEKSKRHPHMSLHDRAAQFAPFAALRGHDEAIEKTAKKVETEYNTEDTVKDIDWL